MEPAKACKIHRVRLSQGVKEWDTELGTGDLDGDGHGDGHGDGDEARRKSCNVASVELTIN